MGIWVFFWVSRILPLAILLATATTHAAVLSSDATSRQVASTFSPNGKLIVTILESDAIAIWSSDTGEQHIILRGHRERISSASFSPDGTRVLSSSEDGTARVWDVRTGNLLLVLAGHKGAVRTAEYSARGNRILTTGVDGTAMVWFTDNGELLDALDDHGDVTYAQISPNGSRVVTTDISGSLRAWDEYGQKMTPIIITSVGVDITPETADPLMQNVRSISDSVVLLDRFRVAENSLKTDSLLETLRLWSDAWSSQDFDRYLSAYDPGFDPGGGISRQAWQVERRQRVEKPASIKVTVSNPVVRLTSAREAEITFTQQYRSDRHVDTCLKQLDLANRDDAWMILREKNLKCKLRPR
ncbi:MAG: dipeptidyl aminopeptidase/acylaminoacyl peptidase [Candidatus Azotimanducaceae bacterium]|jgi:dipeptidyl aminopeptidase/acylaminoacyl peptidase